MRGDGASPGGRGGGVTPSKVLHVWWDGRRVGTLTRNAQGDVRFAYSAAWLAEASLPPISVSLPKQARPFTRQKGLPFFDGILPEGGPREAVARALGISLQNEFGMLLHLGGEVAGALQFLDPERSPAPVMEMAPGRPLADEELLRILDILPTRPFLVGEGGMRLSLAGAQAKLPVVVDAAIFNVLAGNADAHGKNFSLLYQPGGLRLAPLYDLMCTAWYSDLSPTFAMRVGGAANLEEISLGVWRRFAEDAEVGFPYLRRRVRALAEAVPAASARVLEHLRGGGLDDAALANLAAFIGQRAERCAGTCA